MPDPSQQVLCLTEGHELHSTAALASLGNRLQTACPDVGVTRLSSLLLSAGPMRVLGSIMRTEEPPVDLPAALLIVSTRPGRAAEVRGALATTGLATWTVTTFPLLESTGEMGADGVCKVVLAHRRPGMSRQDFRTHYLDQHVPLVLRLGPLFVDYQVSFTDDGGPWDSVTLQRFIDGDTWAEHDRQILEEKPAVVADLGEFLGPSVELSSYEQIQLDA